MYSFFDGRLYRADIIRHVLIGIQLFENLINIMIENEVQSSCRQCVMHARLLPDVYGLAHCSIRIRVCSNSAFLYYRKPNGKDDMCRKVVYIVR
jgi:hypothetical protein